MSIETARAKIKAEASSCGGLEKAIADHLIGIMDDELAALVERPEYTVKEMGSFVMSMARKELKSKSGYLADEVVYGFATDYYHASRAEIKKNAAGGTDSAAPNNVSEKKPKAEKKPEQKTAKPEKPVAKPPEPKPAKKTGPEGQMSLFDMLGGMADA